MNILIVEDQPSNRKLLRAQLEAENHTVFEAENGLKALQLLEREQVDAVISDILMPTMDGFKLCREIRKSTTIDSGIAIVLYTSTYHSPSDRELAETVGADGYLIKPAAVPVLLAALQEARHKAKHRQMPMTPRVDEAYVLERYNMVLVRKLETRNSELQQALADLQTAHERILELNRNLETRVEQRTAALNAANRELESFSYSVAHDLRAPLRHITGFGKILKDRISSQLDEESLSLFGRITDGAQTMNQLVEDLLEFARLSKVELKLTHIDLEAVLEEALQAVQPETQNRNIQWERTRLPKVHGDPALLRQVFVNLLSNALKFTRIRDKAIIEIGCRKGRADEFVFSVRDNGVGFDMRQASALFGAFQRLHSAETFEGTGIGMANAQRIIHRHGGRIWADAQVDGGATFSFSLPDSG